jgi:hypothetical protein
MPGWKPLIGFCDPLVPSTDPTYCGIKAFVTLITNGVHDLVLLSTLMVVALLVYTGIIWLTSGGDPNKHKKAVGLLWNIVWGYVWILAAWVIVYTISKALLNPGFSFLTI